MITLKTLNWSNCFSYGANNSLSLNNEPLTQIIGVNGTGKSSIPLIIEEVLYNKNSKNIKKADVSNRYIGDGYSISLEFSKDDTEYSISVERKGSKIKVVLLENGEDISSHTATNTYKTLQNILGLDFKTFSQLVYQSTTTSLQFLSATDTNRKKFLIELLDLNKYLELLEVFKVAHKEATIKVGKVEAKIETIQSWLESNNLEDTNLQDMLDERIETEEDEKTLRLLSEKFKNLDSKNRKILENNAKKEELQGLDVSILSDSTVAEYQSYDELQKLLGESQAAINSARRMIDKLNGLGDECPTCSQTIDPIFKSKLLSSEEYVAAMHKNNCDKINRDINEIKEANKKVVLKHQVQRDWEELYRSIDKTLPEVTENAELLKLEIAELSERIDYAKKKKRAIEIENTKRLEANAKINFILEQSEKFKEQLQSLEEDIAEAETLASNLEVLKKSFGTNGILAYKIENLVKELEDLTNTYLAELSDGRFTLGFVVSNDRLNVEITDDGEVVDISSLSSGELARVNTSTLIAIRKLMSSISKSRINVLFLDEVIAVLDDAGREKLVEVLLDEENLNTYIVSHHWEHPLLSKLNITKTDNISTIEG